MFKNNADSKGIKRFLEVFKTHIMYLKIARMTILSLHGNAVIVTSVPLCFIALKMKINIFSQLI